MVNNVDEARRQCEMALRELSKVERSLRDAAEMLSAIRLMVQEASDRSQLALEVGASTSRSRRSEP